MELRASAPAFVLTSGQTESESTRSLLVLVIRKLIVFRPQPGRTQSSVLDARVLDTKSRRRPQPPTNWQSDGPSDPPYHHDDASPTRLRLPSLRVRLAPHYHIPSIRSLALRQHLNFETAAAPAESKPSSLRFRVLSQACLRIRLGASLSQCQRRTTIVVAALLPASL
eukprot:888234-Rhodomonas_salina.1